MDDGLQSPIGIETGGAAAMLGMWAIFVTRDRRHPANPGGARRLLADFREVFSIPSFRVLLGGALMSMAAIAFMSLASRHARGPS